jgi:hypothetical protein
MDSSTHIVRRDLMSSMGLLALVIILALFRIAWTGNWLKVLRVWRGLRERIMEGVETRHERTA